MREGGKYFIILREMKKTCHGKNAHKDGDDATSFEESYGVKQVSTTKQPKASHLSHFLPTSRRIVQFSNGKVCNFDFSFFSPYAIPFLEYLFIPSPQRKVNLIGKVFQL